jgi:hypothetical protein
LGERELCKLEVVGSIPIGSTIPEARNQVSGIRSCGSAFSTESMKSKSLDPGVWYFLIPDPRSLFSDNVNGGICRMHSRLISNTTLKTDRNCHSWRERHSRGRANSFARPKRLAFFLGMERMLSDQALKQGRLGDALAHTGDEGRSTLR